MVIQMQQCLLLERECPQPLLERVLVRPCPLDPDVSACPQEVRRGHRVDTCLHSPEGNPQWPCLPRRVPQRFQKHYARTPGQ
jgi:hypothetical protein